MKYLLGTPEDFHNFVNLISKKSKIRIISHTDLDGIVSALFLKKILDSKGLKVNSIDFLDYDSDVLKNYAEKNKFDFLFFTDWNADSLSEGLTALRNKGKVFIIDHHPLNESLEDKSNMIKTPSSYCASHILFDLSKNYFDTNDFIWLISATMIADYCFIDNEVMTYLQSVYPSVTKENIWESEPGKRSIMLTNALIYYKKNLSKFYNLLLREKIDKIDSANGKIVGEINLWLEKFVTEAEHLPEHNLYFYYATPKYRISSTVVSILSSTKFPNDTLVFVSDVKDKKNFVKLSARNQSGKIDLNQILKSCISGFEDATAGGHAKASAGQFPKKYLEEFKKRLFEKL